MDMGIAIEDRGAPVISSYAGNASCIHQDVAATATLCVRHSYRTALEQHTNTHININIQTHT